MSAISEILLDIFFPRRCPVCHKIVLPKGELVCPKCRKDLVLIKEPRCKKCSKPLLYKEQEYCFDCTQNQYHYNRGYALYLYQGVVKDSLMQLKFFGKQEYAVFFGKQMADSCGEWIRTIRPDMILPVPLHKKKLRMRGYNQAELLARELSKCTKIPMHTGWLVRNRYTMPQKKLNNKERLKNLTKAFQVAPEKNFHQNELYQARVLLVDDIYTTGSTIEACTIQLLKAGCQAVYFITVCIGKGY